MRLLLTYGLWYKGLRNMPSYTNRKDYTAEMLCEEADIISQLRKNSQVK
jgi:hypothetical protein